MKFYYIWFLLIAALYTFQTHSVIIAYHEHELIADADLTAYENDVKQSIELLRKEIPGLLAVYHLKGIKGMRSTKYSILWLFANEQTLVDNFGTLSNPKCPSQWEYFENKILAKYLIGDPDRITFTDYAIVNLAEK